MEYMLSGCGTFFDERIVKAFLNSLIVFPKGTLVRLSDKSAAVVTEHNYGYPMRPKVRRMTGEFIDLLQINNLTIVDFIL